MNPSINCINPANNPKIISSLTDCLATAQITSRANGIVRADAYIAKIVVESAITKSAGIIEEGATNPAIEYPVATKTFTIVTTLTKSRFLSFIVLKIWFIILSESAIKKGIYIGRNINLQIL